MLNAKNVYVFLLIIKVKRVNLYNVSQGLKEVIVVIDRPLKTIEGVKLCLVN